LLSWGYLGEELEGGACGLMPGEGEDGGNCLVKIGVLLREKR